MRKDPDGMRRHLSAGSDRPAHLFRRWLPGGADRLFAPLQAGWPLPRWVVDVTATARPSPDGVFGRLTR